jgi:hypothetical protein
MHAYMTRNSMSEPETTRLTITWSKEADHALRTFLGSQGMTKGDLEIHRGGCPLAHLSSDRPRGPQRFR